MPTFQKKKKYAKGSTKGASNVNNSVLSKLDWVLAVIEVLKI